MSNTDRRGFIKSAVAIAGLGQIGPAALLTHEDGTEHIVCRIRDRNSEVEVTRRIPTSLYDPYWDEIVGSPEDIHRLALKQFVFNAQAAARSRLSRYGEDEAQVAFASYEFLPRYGPREKIAASFSQEQIDWLRKQGMKLS